MPSGLDDMLAAVRAGLEERRVRALERAAAIKAAADAYAAAVEREALAEIAAKLEVTMDAPSGVTAREAARDLEKAVARLPELAKSASTPPKPIPEAKARSAPNPGERPASSTKSDSFAAKLTVPTALREKLSGSPRKPGTPADSSAASSSAGTFPRLQAASQRGRVVIVGGLAKADALGRLKARLGFEPEWLETDKAGQHGIRKLEGRILDGRIAAVIVLDGLIGHAHFEPLARATRQTGTLLVYGDRAGRASLEKALTTAEGHLEKKKR